MSTTAFAIKIEWIYVYKQNSKIMCSSIHIYYMFYDDVLYIL